KGYRAKLAKPPASVGREMAPQSAAAPFEDSPTDGGTTPGGDVVPGIQVVMLPDFEEQYAIRNRNVAAKSTYDLHFTDGWQLDSVNGTWNSTELPIRILESITKVIKAAEVLQLQAIQSSATG